MRGLTLHAPAADGPRLDQSEHDVFDKKTDENDRKQSGKNLRNIELILRLENIPAQSALPRRGAEDKLGSDQRAPGERPADLEAGQNAWKRRGDENLRHKADPAQPVILTDHAMRGRYAAKPPMRVERDSPQHGVNQHENQASRPQPEPDQGERQKRDRR